jgi:septum formation protein
VSQPVRLYLASASPRRQELLGHLAVPFAVTDAPVDEEALEAAFAQPVAHLAEHLAQCKAAAALESLRDQGGEPIRVLAGDTTVLLDGEVLGKPRDAAHAAAMLQALRGHIHRVVTALALAEGGAGDEPVAIHSLAVRTRVVMRRYTDSEIADYIATCEPFDKAGGYAIQDAVFHPVHEITGCYPSVVGFPVCAAAMLLGIRPAAAPDLAGGCPWSALCRAPLPECAR